MKRTLLLLLTLCTLTLAEAQTKQLVAYFSGTGTTQRVAEEIQRLTGADILRIQPSEPYSSNPYNDSDRIQDEAYNNRRPGVANLPDNLDDYDVIFIGSPIWWHYPAMVCCTFLEAYDLTGKTVVPFFTYAATTYFQQSVNKILEVTPNSTHLTAFGSTGSTSGVESWLERIGQLPDATSISTAVTTEADAFSVTSQSGQLEVILPAGTTAAVYTPQGSLAARLSSAGRHQLSLPTPALYVVSATNVATGERCAKTVRVGK